MTKKFFIVARHTQSLRNSKRPDQGFVTNESIMITKNVKNRDYSEAAIILDVAQGKVIKNRYNDRSFEDLYVYFVTHYSDHINRWLKANSSNAQIV